MQPGAGCSFCKLPSGGPLEKLGWHEGVRVEGALHTVPAPPCSPARLEGEERGRRQPGGEQPPTALRSESYKRVSRGRRAAHPGPGQVAGVWTSGG